MKLSRTCVAVLGVTALAASWLVVGAVTPAGALTSYTVTSTTDGAMGSLRDMIDLANTDGDDSEIDLPADATLDLDDCGTFAIDDNTNASGDLDHTEDNELTINGNGATIRQTCAGQRVLHLLGDSPVQIWDVTITGGDVSVGTGGGNGGGISSEGGGDLLVALTTIDGNQAANVGGGIVASSRAGTDRVTIIDSTISNNTASLAGGGVYTVGSNLIVNSTISGNSAEEYAGAIVGDTELIYATVYGNGTEQGAGGDQLDIGVLTTFGSVIAGGFGGASDCLIGSVVSLGWNADGDGSCDLTDPTDQPDIDPQLGPLADNGGLTLTHLPESSSPLVDTIPPGSCDVTYVADQRNISRPQGSGCETGSVEIQVQAGSTTTTTTTAAPTPAAQPVPATPAFTG